MKILFITGLYPKGKEKEYSSKCKNTPIQNAANEFQWRFVEGLHENNADFYVISLPFLPSWPRNYKDIYTDSGEITYKNKTIGRYVKYCTIPAIKGLSLTLRLRKEIKGFLKNFPKEQVCIITYNSLNYMQEAVRPLKKKYDIKLVSIITDLIDDATNPTFKLSTLKYIQARLAQRSVWKSYDYTDGFILLSKYMTERIPQAIGKSIVVEGIAKDTANDEIRLKPDNIKSIVYTGSLAEFTGVRKLVDAFMQTTDKNYRLIICGKGELTKYIESCALKDSRIDYRGIVTHSEATDLQREAKAVINPRQPNSSITRYSFPSKTMEYLLSGTAMIGYRLEGIPEEYYEHFYSPSDMSVEALSRTIEYVLDCLPEDLMEKATKAKCFILENKTATKQVERVLSFISKM